MDNGFVDSRVHFLRVEGLASEFEILGTSILAHLMALPGLFSKKDSVTVSPTIQGLGLLFSKPRKMAGFSYKWVGKAFEYAVADLFNHQSEPYYSLIRQGIENALKTLVSSKAGKVSLDIDRLSCIRVAKEYADTEDLVRAFGGFRLLQNASLTIGYAATKWPGLEYKVDVIFCEKDIEPVYRFAVLANLKSNREALSQDDKVRRNFVAFPLDLGITVETPKYKGVSVYQDMGVPVVHLPMEVSSGVHVWRMATEIVKQALIEGEKNALLWFFKKFFKQNTPENYWVEFLANRVQVDIAYVVEEIRQTLHQTPGERIVTVPVILGPKEDAVLDLVTP